MRQSSVITDLLNAITDPTSLFGDRRKPKRRSRDVLLAMIAAVLGGRGEASSSERAAEFLRAYRDLDYAGRTFVFRKLAAKYGPDTAGLKRAAKAYLESANQGTAKALQSAAEPRRVEVFRRLNQVKGGTQALVALRTELLERLPNHPDLWVVDDDLRRLFNAWFNRGFLVLREIDWQTSAAILAKIIRYEAVHAINGWDDLRLRIDVPDRRLFGFFHPRLGDEPLIFVEVALTQAIPSAIGPILAPDREPISPTEATCAVFYSISNCQDGLRGISFGSFLIKQVARNLMKELPNLKTFVTLSPVPEFARWLKEEASREGSGLDKSVTTILDIIEANPDWLDDEATAKAASAALIPLLAHYLTVARDARGRVVDPVARFHLGNGARLERLNFGADRSEQGLYRAHGFMVNYRYILEEVEKNHEAFLGEGLVVAASPIAKLARQVKLTERTEPEVSPALPAPDQRVTEPAEN
ncbi:MAG: malonyl-CoA decarboxylase [Pseudomonadota bacterium]